jgi:hypothetical protein
MILDNLLWRGVVDKVKEMRPAASPVKIDKSMGTWGEIVPVMEQPIIETTIVLVEKGFGNTLLKESSAAVVAMSSSPIKGGPEDAVWMKFYTNKLNPEKPGHAQYLNEFVEIYRTMEKSSSWYEFFQSVEPDSPWQVVVQTANKRGGEKKAGDIVVEIPVMSNIGSQPAHPWYGGLSYKIIWNVIPFVFNSLFINIPRWWGMQGGRMVDGIFVTLKEILNTIQPPGSFRRLFAVIFENNFPRFVP